MDLNKEDIRFVFNEPSLEVGDILLMNTYHERQRRLMQCRFDHAAIYLGDAFIMEADGLGVMMNHIYSYGFKKEDHACVLRLKGNHIGVIKDSVHWIRSRMGMEFGAKQARMVLQNKNSEKNDDSNRSFCSRLVAQAYHEGGVDIVPNPDFCAPDDFLNTDKLMFVPNSMQPFTEEMTLTLMNGWKQREDVDWNTSLHEMFKDLSNVYGEDIQLLEQLCSAALRKVDKDTEAISHLKKQQWMTEPKEQTKQIWPWFYDDEQFFAHFPKTRDVLFFLYNQMTHYDLTYLPIFRENALSMEILSKIRKDSTVVHLLHEHFDGILHEAISVRKRLADLYQDILKRDEDGFNNFIREYGPYVSFKYTEGIIDISKIVEALLLYGPSNIVELLKE